MLPRIIVTPAPSVPRCFADGLRNPYASIKVVEQDISIKVPKGTQGFALLCPPCLVIVNRNRNGLRPRPLSGQCVGFASFSGGSRHLYCRPKRGPPAICDLKVFSKHKTKSPIGRGEARLHHMQFECYFKSKTYLLINDHDFNTY